MASQIRGVFFWVSPGESAITVGLNVRRLAITNCVAYGDRPKWWQIRRRYRILRLIERLPDGCISIGDNS